MQKLLPPLLFVILAATNVALETILPEPRLPEPFQHLGWPLMAIGALLLITARVQFSKAKTNIYTFDEPGVMLTTGVFAISRNPMYLGFTLMLAGIALWQSSWVGIPVVLAFLICCDRWYIRHEELRMMQKFGQRFLDYKNRTRRWL
ncbi:isoprenylcysteine carboxylmethyltransferase family protein [Hydrogenophaga sp. 5NK40-0174]|uniref:methyltransferase family protein n=1 Tax=Hydrogenophaga sp. 5NK40-0174 TaxID=3127649 RepID=UPI0031069A34